MSENIENHYQNLDIKFVNESNSVYQDDIEFIKHICSGCLEGDETEKNLIEFMSCFLVGIHPGSHLFDCSITIGCMATADFIYEDGFIEYDLIRGPYGINIVAFEDEKNCLVLEENLAIKEIIKIIREIYKARVSACESPSFIEAYMELVRMFKLEKEYV